MIRAVKDNRRNYFTILIPSVLLMIIFIRSYYWTVQEITKRKILEALIVVFFVVVLPVISVWIKPINGIINKWHEGVKETKKFFQSSYQNNKIRLLIEIVTFLIIAPITVYGIGGVLHNRMMGYTLCAICYVLYFLYIYRNVSEKKPEGLFACLAMVTGLLVILVTPASPGVMVDDETHYARVVDLADFFNGVDYTADERILSGFMEVIFEKKGYDKESRDALYTDLNELYSSRALTSISSGSKGIAYVAYIPSAIGIIMGRGLSLSYVHIFMLGKVFNLLLFVVIMYYAIKRLRYGKILFMAMGLIPTLVVISASYSYDGWVFAFLSLGYSYFISMLQGEEKIKTKDIIMMNIAFFLGFMPKAVYVVIMFPLLFMPKEKFQTKNQRKLYYFVAVIAVILLVVSFVLPILMGTSTGDHRGGEGISVMGQLSYILHNVKEYIAVLFNFLKDYLAFGNSQKLFQFYAYLGTGKFYLLVLMTIAVVAFLDKSGDRKRIMPIRIGAIVGAIGGILIVATTFYLVFTPVGANTIAGCQYRYILPTLIPFLYFIVPEGIGSSAKKNWLANVSAFIMSTTLIYNIYNLAVIPYM